LACSRGGCRLVYGGLLIGIAQGRLPCRWLPNTGPRRRLIYVRLLVGLADHRRLIRLVLGCLAQLIAGHVEDHLRLLALTLETQRLPFDGDLAGAYAHEAAELDHGRLHLPAAVRQQVDDATHILLHSCADIAAEHAFEIAALAGPRSFRGP